MAVDLSDLPQCEKLVEEAHRIYGPVGVLVNNAAMVYLRPVKDYPLSRAQRTIAVNLHAPFYLSQLVLHDMLPRKSGAIVNVSSSASAGPGRGPYPEFSGPGRSLYGAEKAALERFTQGLASEVYTNGISVTCVSPSQGVPTPATVYRKNFASLDDERGEPPSMMANAVLLLATEPLERVSGRVTHSQAILKEFGWIKDGQGRWRGSRRVSL